MKVVHFPNTEGIAPVRRTTDRIATLPPVDRHPMIRESERVLRLLYTTIAAHDMRHPAMLSHVAKQAVLALHDALLRHDLAEQSIRLTIAIYEIRKCSVFAANMRVVHALAEVDRFLALPVSAK